MSTKRILLIDDDVVTLAALGNLLGRQQHEVTKCSASREATYLALKSRWDVIILDLGMPSPNPERIPDFDGLKLLQWIARSGSGCPVIIFTGFNGAPLEGRALGLGAFAVVSKREPPEKLLETVETALERQAPDSMLPTALDETLDTEGESPKRPSRLRALVRMFC